MNEFFTDDILVIFALNAVCADSIECNEKYVVVVDGEKKNEKTSHTLTQSGSECSQKKKN